MFLRIDSRFTFLYAGKNLPGDRTASWQSICEVYALLGNYTVNGGGQPRTGGVNATRYARAGSAYIASSICAVSVHGMQTGSDLRFCLQLRAILDLCARCRAHAGVAGSVLPTWTRTCAASLPVHGTFGISCCAESQHKGQYGQGKI